ncbi:MAG: methyl-accepting chemotaxis protein [Ruminiclostridium sp.]
MKKNFKSMIKTAFISVMGFAFVNALITVIVSVMAMNNGMEITALVPEGTGADAISKAQLLNILLIAIPCVIFVLLAVACIIIMIYLNKEITAPVDDMVQAAEKIANGDINAEVTYSKDNEFGVIAASLRKMIESSKLQAKEIAAIAEGDFTNDITLRSEDDAVGKSIRKLSDNINHVFANIYQGAIEVNNGGEQVASASQNLSQGATEQASTIEELSASIAEVKDAVQNNANNAKDALENVAKAVKEVENGNHEMTEMLKAMDDISKSSSEIAKIIKVIEDIAFQTNILALNSAVEAARAGEAGKGFAVVADEVKNLAMKSQDAAQQTTALIEGCVRSVEEGVIKANSTANALNSIAQHEKEIDRIVSKVSKACEEQATAVAQINMGIDQISVVVQTTSATAEQCAASSEELTSRSSMLRSEIGQFKVKGSVKAAESAPAQRRAAVQEPAPQPVKAAPEPVRTVPVSTPRPSSVINLGDDDKY